MAGDWIKMRTDLQTHPKVVRISSALHVDRLRVVGGLHAVWSLFDAHSIDGSLDGYTPESLDSLLGFDGFTLALESAGWIVVGDKGLCLPRFEEHNGHGAKRRAEDQKRKRGVRKVSAVEPDKLRTREEKRREEKSKDKTPYAPLTDQREPKKTRKKTATYMAPEWRPSADLVSEMQAEYPAVDVERAIPEFRNYWIGEGKAKADWGATFRNRIGAISDRPARPNRRPDALPVTVDGPELRRLDEIREAARRLKRDPAAADYIAYLAPDGAIRHDNPLTFDEWKERKAPEAAHA